MPLQTYGKERTDTMAGKVYQVRNIYQDICEGAGGRKAFTARVPGSKSITNRALLLSMLSDGDCVLKGALFSDDSRYLVQCIADLGFAITADEAAEKKAQDRERGSKLDDRGKTDRPDGSGEKEKADTKKADTGRSTPYSFR